MLAGDKDRADHSTLGGRQFAGGRHLKCPFDDLTPYRGPACKYVHSFFPPLRTRSEEMSAVRLDGPSV